MCAGGQFSSCGPCEAIYISIWPYTYAHTDITKCGFSGFMLNGYTKLGGNREGVWGGI